MQKLQNRLSDWHLREIRQIETLIREYCKTPDLIMLHGEFVDGTPRSVEGGYEILIMLSNTDMVDRVALQDYITDKYPTPERLVRRIRCEILPTKFFRTHVSKSGYLNSIFYEGVVLFDAEPRLWDHISGHKHVKQKHSKNAKEQIIRHLEYGDGMMDAADQMMIGRYWDVCPHFLYHAVDQYCMAMELHYYGFIRKYDQLSRRYEMVRHGSEKLTAIATEKQSELQRMFRNLTKFRELCLYSHEYHTPLEGLEKYEKLIKEIRDVIWNTVLPEENS